MKNWLLAFVGGDGTGKSTQIRMLMEWLKGEGYTIKSSREPGGSRRGEVIRSILMDRKKGFDEEQQKIVNFDLVRLANQIGESDSKYASVAEHVLKLSTQTGMSDDFEIVLFGLARLIHYVEEIKPYQEGMTSEDAFAIDRFWPCTYAYQICARIQHGQDRETAKFMNDFFDWHVEYLDSVGVRHEFVVFDVPVDVALRRIGLRPEEQTDFDKLAHTFHESVRNGYRSWQAQCNVAHPYARFRASAHLVDASLNPEEVFLQVKKIMQLRMNGTSGSDATTAVA